MKPPSASFHFLELTSSDLKYSDTNDNKINCLKNLKWQQLEPTTNVIVRADLNITFRKNSNLTPPFLQKFSTRHLSWRSVQILAFSTLLN